MNESGEYRDEFRDDPERKGGQESQFHLPVWNWRGALRAARGLSGDDVMMGRKLLLPHEMNHSNVVL